MSGERTIPDLMEALEKSLADAKARMDERHKREQDSARGVREAPERP